MTTKAWLAVGIPRSPRAWREALRERSQNQLGGVVLYDVDAAQQVFAMKLHAVVVDDDTSWLSAPFVRQARDRGITLVGVFDEARGDRGGLQRLRRLGINSHLPSGCTAHDVLDAVRTDRSQQPNSPGWTTQPLPRRPLAERFIMAVGGPTGSEATEVALALSHALSRGLATTKEEGVRPKRTELSARTILVDVDETQPSLPRRLGLATQPDLLAAIEVNRLESSNANDLVSPTALAFHESDALVSAGSTANHVPTLGGPRRRFEPCLARPVAGNGELPFDVIVGLVGRDDWRLARPTDVGELLDELAAIWSSVVVRLGPQLEDLSPHIDRYEISRVSAARAGHVIGVCQASADGLLRFADWLSDVVSVVDVAPIDVVLNGVCSATIEYQLLQLLQEMAGDRIGRVVTAAHDESVGRAAWAGALVESGPLVDVATTLVSPRLFRAG